MSFCVLILTRKSNYSLINKIKSIIRDCNVYFISDMVSNIKDNNSIYYGKSTTVSRGYSHSCSFKKCTAWDKAFRFVIEKELNYEYYWFIEDDVYFDARINDIFKYYSSFSQDFIYPTWLKSKKKDYKWSHWKKGIKYFSKQYLSSSLNVVCRVSKLLINKINLFRVMHRRLIFHEILLPSLCAKYNLKMIKLSPIFKKKLAAGHNSTLKSYYKKLSPSIILLHPYKNWYLK